MRFAFDDEQLALRDGVRALLDGECTPADIRAAWDSDTGRSAPRWAALARMGVVGLTIDERHGGLGLDEVALVLVLEAAGWAGLPEPLAAVTAVGAPLLADVAPAPVVDEWLPRIAAGEATVAVGLDGIRYVDDAHIADLLLLADGDALHAVSPDAVTLVAQPSVDRTRRRYRVDWQPNARSCIVASAAGALQLAADRTAMAAAAQSLGVARRLLSMATGYAGQREQFGVPIGSFQALQHQLATALVKIEFAAPAVYRAAWSIATDQPGRARHATMARRLAAQAAHVTARAALQVHGAIGYTDEHDLHLWLRRALDPAAAR